jgi:cell division protein FtsB
MAAPRFRLRSLVVVIAFLAMALTIGTLTVQNTRLARELQAERRRADMERRLTEEARRIAELEVLRARGAMVEAQAKSSSTGK